MNLGNNDKKVVDWIGCFSPGGKSLNKESESLWNKSMWQRVKKSLDLGNHDTNVGKIV